VGFHELLVEIKTFAVLLSHMEVLDEFLVAFVIGLLCCIKLLLDVSFSLLRCISFDLLDNILGFLQISRERSSSVWWSFHLVFNHLQHVSVISMGLCLSKTDCPKLVPQEGFV